MGFKEDLPIDLNDLAFECTDQPIRFMRYASLYAKAVRKRNLAKQQINVARTEAMTLIRRSDPKDYGLSNWTEPSIKTVLDSHPSVLAAEKAYYAAMEEADILQAAKEAFQDRRYELGNLINLHVTGYFSMPSTGVAGKQARSLTEDEISQIRDEQRSALADLDKELSDDGLMG